MNQYNTENIDTYNALVFFEFHTERNFYFLIAIISNHYILIVGNNNDYD